MIPSSMRRFNLLREQDVSGVSGTGVVAEGCELSNGYICMMWLSAHMSIVIFPNAEELENIHGHEGATKIVWLDE